MNTSNTTRQNPITRRRWGQWALAATMGAGLAACGGGGVGSDEPPTLREAFDRLQPGMTKKQVYELTARTPVRSSTAHYQYEDGSEKLYVSFAPDSSTTSDNYLINDATWSIINGESITRGY